MVASLFMLGCISAQPATTAHDKKYIAVMETTLQQLDTASVPSTYIMLANTFERIGNTEKKYWQPWYYAALCHAFMAMNNPDKNMIDPFTAKADEYLVKASVLSHENSEISALKGMITNTKILVDPISRWQTYSAEATAFLNTAKSLDPSNPRPYLIEARTKLFTPVTMGGGLDAARPLIEIALRNFAVFIPGNSIAPKWGLAQTNAIYAKVNGQ